MDKEDLKTIFIIAGLLVILIIFGLIFRSTAAPM